MDRVVASQLHSKRVLEKQLNEIEAKQHQNEARRLKQIRDLGVDLTKIQRTSRDLDDVIHDLSPRYSQQRRGSLPPLENRGGLPFQLEQPRTSRSRRRLSCIADISQPHRESAGHLNNVFSAKANLAAEKHKQLPAIKKDNVEFKTKSSSTEAELCREKNKIKTKADKSRNSNEINEVCKSQLSGPRCNTQTNNICSGIYSDHITSKIHMNDEIRSDIPEAKPSSDDISEVELQSIFADAKRSNRRSSEPELRSNFIRGLQDITLMEIPSFQYPNDAESEELRKSIQKNLPSDIVAETDEDEQEADENNDDKTNDFSNSLSARPRHRLTSISESDQDNEQNETPAMAGQNKFETESKNGPQTSVDSLKVTDNNNYLVSRRRKSDGDVLVHGLSRKFNSTTEKHPFWQIK